MKIFTTLAASAALAMAFATYASACVGVNCNQPTAVQRGQSVPVWHVTQCVIGPMADGSYQAISCQNPAAVHMSPRGDMVVCFIGSDGKFHWDAQYAVREGREFINRRVNGIWQPDWQ